MIITLVSISFLKNKSSFIYILKHYLLYFFEIVASSMLINYVIGGFKEESTLVLLKDFIFSYTVYQLILLTFFKIKDSTDTDTLNAMKVYLDTLLLYLEFDKENHPQLIESAKLAQGSCRNKKHVRLWAQIIESQEAYAKKILKDEDYKFYLKNIILKVENENKTINFFWMNSLLLRIFK
ncbi:hypothetical protein SAEN111111_10135 [Saccharibacillus endophyticus]